MELKRVVSKTAIDTADLARKAGNAARSKYNKAFNVGRYVHETGDPEMNMTIIDYVVKAGTGGSPIVIPIPAPIVGIETDDVLLNRTIWDIYTSFDGIEIHSLEGLTAQLARAVLWVPNSVNNMYKLRAAGPHFAMDPGGLNEANDHKFRLYCRGTN